MSSNNVVWVMNHITVNGLWHVFYSGCIDNTPKLPDYKNKYYKAFDTRTGAILYAHDVVDKIDKESWEEGFAGVEYGVCELHLIDPKLEKRFERIKPTLDVLAMKSKEVTNKDIQDFVKLVEEMINRLGEKVTAIDHNHGIRIKKLEGKPQKRKDGCYQFTYCNECLAYPMGLGCPNIVKGPVQLKDGDSNEFLEVRNCDICEYDKDRCDYERDCIKARKLKDGKSKEKWQEHDEDCYQYCSEQIEEMLKDGVKSQSPYNEMMSEEEKKYLVKLSDYIIKDGETPSKCEFYYKDYCIPCKSPEKFYECEMVKIGNQIKLDKDGETLDGDMERHTPSRKKGLQPLPSDSKLYKCPSCGSTHIGHFTQGDGYLSCFDCMYEFPKEPTDSKQEKIDRVVAKHHDCYEVEKIIEGFEGKIAVEKADLEKIFKMVGDVDVCWLTYRRLYQIYLKENEK